MMTAIERNKQFTSIGRIFLSAIFLIAAGAKMTDLTRFSRIIEAFLGALGLGHYHWLVSVAGLMAGSVIIAEWALGGVLLSGWKPRLTAKAAVFLLSVFFVIKIVGKATGSMKECGCWGALGEASTFESFLIDLVILIFSVSLYLRLKPACEVAPIEAAGGQRITASQRAILCNVLLLGGALFGACQIWTPPWAAIREGGRLPADLPLTNFTPDGSMALWILDPNCTECVEKTAIVNQQIARYPTLAITDATEGRINEYRLDYAPQFEVKQVSAKLLHKLGLPMGSIAVCRDKKVVEIVRLNQLNPGYEPDSTSERNRP